jgi:accessory gene regulator protein AgrB
MSRRKKIGIVAFLVIFGFVVLLIGFTAHLYSLSLSIVFAAILWISAALVYMLVRGSKHGKFINRTITDSDCRQAITRHPR